MITNKIARDSNINIQVFGDQRKNHQNRNEINESDKKVL